MKLRAFAVLTLSVGLLLLLALAVPAQKAEVKSSSLSTLDVGPADSVVYLPAVFNGYGAPPGVPLLISPANGSTLDTLIPIFRWDAGSDPDATGLGLHGAEDPDFTQIFFSSGGAAGGLGETWFPANFPPATTYYWRAWLRYGETDGPYSQVWSFTTGSGGIILPAPTLIAPANASVLPSLSVTLQWSGVAGAVGYMVSWQRVGSGTFTVERVTEAQIDITGLRANNTYDWWVSARNDYAFGDESEHWQFTTPAEP